MTTSDGRFGYYALMGDIGSREVTSILAAFATGRGPAQGVVWNLKRQQWVFSPEAMSYYLYDDDNAHMSYSVDRVGAEQLALELFHSELPSEEELRRLCAEGLVIWLAEEASLENDDEDLENEVFDDEDDPSTSNQS